MKRILAIFISITLLASSIASALVINVKQANATVSSDELVLRDVIASGREHFSGDQLTVFESIISSYIEPVFDNGRYLICVCCPTTTFDSNIWHMTIYRGNNSNDLWYMNSNGYLSNYKSGESYATTYCYQVANVICNVSESYYIVNMPSGSGNQESYINNLPTFSRNGSGALAAPCGQTFTSASCGVWFNRDIRKLYDDYGLLYSANMILEIPLVYFELLVFWLGERRYLTIKNQALVRQLSGNEQYNYVLAVSYDYDVDIIEDLDMILYDYNDSILLQYSGVESQLSNISPAGVYAFDITDLDYNRIVYADIDDLDEYDGVEFRKVGEATNVPIVLQEVAPEPGTGGTPDSYTTMWQEFITYVNNYNTTPIVPSQLSTSLFGINGLQCYPVSVNVPEDVWNSGGNSNHDDLTTWKWWTNQSNLGINFELMDTVIIASGEFLYTLVYFNSTSLQVAFVPVQNVEITELFTMFDCVIIVPDDKGCLDKTAWYEGIIQALGQVMNLNVTFGNNIAISGTSSLGVEYLSSIPSTYNDILTGYCFVTPKGIQRQQLFAFADGVTKVYELMVDYVESEDSWKSSFLQWSASMFTGMQSIVGYLDSIHGDLKNYFQSVLDKLDRLVNNTDEAIHNFWILPLYNFVTSFVPSIEGFANWIGAIEDFGDELPALPTITVVPAIPTFSPTPT